MTSNGYLSSQFRQSHTDVSQYVDWIERNYTRPAKEKMQAFYEEYPVLSVFAAVFALLSVFPVSIYLGLCLFALVLSLLSALCAVVSVFVVTALALGSILALILLINVFLSTFITFFLASFFLVYKIAVAGYSGGVNGARQQVMEFYELLRFSIQGSLPSFPAKNRSTSDDDKHTDSANSTAMIDAPASEAGTAVEERSAWKHEFDEF